MSKVSEMTREKWIMSTFPEWGTWLVEDIENEVVQPGNVAMWWLGCTGIWFKTPGGANITIDLWCGNGKRTHGDGKMKVGHQMANMCGGRAMQPNLRNVPFVIDPFAFKQVDAVLATHYHQDHMSAEWAAHVINSGMTTTDENGKEIPVPFIGPLKSVETWVKWGVPEERCRIVKPGDTIKIKDIEIVCLDSFDRTCIVTTDSTGPDREELTGKCPTDMDEKAVNYLVKTPGGANITIDLWCGNGKRTHGDGKMKVGHQMANMCGGRAMRQDDLHRRAAHGREPEVQGGRAHPLGRVDQLPGRLRGDQAALRLQEGPQRVQVPPVLLAGRRQVRLSPGQGQDLLPPSPRLRGLLRGAPEHPLQVLPVSRMHRRGEGPSLRSV